MPKLEDRIRGTLFSKSSSDAVKGALGAPKELKLGPDHAQSSRSRLGVQDPGPDHAQDDFVDSCMVFMRWKPAKLV